jgi:hypothetical protein
MTPTRKPSRFPSLGRALLALAAGATLTGALAQPAHACGMRAFYYDDEQQAPRRDPAALLADARRYLDQGHNISALLAAKSLVASPRASRADRAEGWAIIGWVRWQRGQRKTALQAINYGRALDRAASDSVITRFADRGSAKALRRALGVA